MYLTWLLAILTLSAAAHAADPPFTKAERAAQRACADAAEGLNTLVDWAKSVCFVPRGGVRKMVFTTGDNVFGAGRPSDAFLATLVAAAGDAIRRNPDAAVAEVNFMDRNLGAHRKYWVIQATDAVRLQGEVKNDRLTMEQYLAAVLAAGREVELPPKK